MSFFAVLKTKDSSPLRVIDCHLNLWSIGGLLNHRLLFFDVGLALEGIDVNGTSVFDLAVPFETLKGEILDLGSKLRNQEVLNLIFAGNAKLSASGTQSKIEYGGKTLLLYDVDISQSEPIENGLGFSTWKIRLASAINKGQQVYVRIRFKVSNSGHTWLWKRSVGAKNGALIDFRVGDVRGTSTANGHLLIPRVLKIENLYLFVIAPFWLKLQTVSPSLYYIRLLEGKVWQPYLDVATNLFRNEKSVIYQWRKTDVTTDDDAFHAFLYLGRDSPFVTYFALLRGALLLLITAAVLTYLVQNWPQIILLLQDNFREVGAGGVIAFAVALLKDWKYVRTAREFISRVFGKMEHGLLRMRATMRS